MVADSNEKPPLVVLAGPTASGKSSAAMTIAARYDAELIGADSVQVYRGFDVGSAKASADERAAVRHHLIDVLDPTEAVDAAEYARLADAAIAEVHGRGKRALVVGGTGLWIRALIRGLVDLPPVDHVLRAQLEDEGKRDGAAALHARLAMLDPISAESIHPNDTMRVVRALEVHTQTGRPLGELRAEHARGAPRYPTLFIVIDCPIDVLTGRIEARLEGMWAAGFEDEVRALLDRWPSDARAFGSVGYRQMVALVKGEADETETRTAIRHATRQYARRQRNWFNAEQGVGWRASREELLSDGGLDRIGRHWRGDT